MTRRAPVSARARRTKLQPMKPAPPVIRIVSMGGGVYPVAYDPPASPTPPTLRPLQALVLSVVQGVTEFLPISSSGHLILVPYFLKWPDQGLTFDIATHVGTLLAILVYFRRDVRDLVVGFFTGQPTSADGDYPPRKLAWMIAPATIPARVAGLPGQGPTETQARSTQRPR